MNEDVLLANNLKNKEVRFFHAISYIDFFAYCDRWAILSRSELAKNHNYTKFFSDNMDQQLGVWDRTFGNLNDFGKYFWSYESATPNAYGPITIVLGKKVWDSLNDIKITKKTITSSDNENILSSNLNDIFELDKDVYRLKAGYTGAEISVANSFISLDALSYILVDPLIISGQSLRDHVIGILSKKEILGVKITENQVIERRIYCEAQRLRINQLVNWSRILSGRLVESNEPLNNTLPSDLEGWFNGLEEWKKRIMASWLTYTFNGTLKWLD